uniref:Uncharacterized protein n=1 Tax=Candidatus Kentrum sp. MB TaxID=2138164 RepID=A0A450XI05_9GAMM|nr:MAG: hypothetical protein BECKMB1821G_GA0114241_104323 [Candidatus Kentron sp. MB]
MVRHQASGMYCSIETFLNIAKNRKKFPSVIVRQIDVLSPISSGSDVIKSALKFQSKWSCHACLFIVFLSPVRVCIRKLAILDLRELDLREGERKDLTHFVCWIDRFLFTSKHQLFV